MRDYEVTTDPDTLATTVQIPAAEKVARDVAATIANDHEGKVVAALVKLGWTPPHDGLISSHASDASDIVNLLRAHKGGWAFHAREETGREWSQGSFTPERAADEIERLRVLFRVNMLRHAPQATHAEIDAILFPSVPEQPEN